MGSNVGFILLESKGMAMAIGREGDRDRGKG